MNNNKSTVTNGLNFNIAAEEIKKRKDKMKENPMRKIAIQSVWNSYQAREMHLSICTSDEERVRSREMFNDLRFKLKSYCQLGVSHDIAYLKLLIERGVCHSADQFTYTTNNMHTNYEKKKHLKKKKHHNSSSINNNNNNINNKK